MKKLLLGLLVGILFLQVASAAVYYDYYPGEGARFGASVYDNSYRYNSWENDYFDEESYCKYWDRGELEWDRDRVCEWMNAGDVRESVLRTRAAVWQSESFDARYNINSGRSTGDAYYYHYGDKSETKSSDWRYKRTYDPRVDNEYVMGNGYYYYQPRFDYESGTFNWRF